METLPAQKNTQEDETKYFEAYEAKDSDLKLLQKGIDALVGSKLLEERVLDEIRFVTYDSKYLYIFTKGEHVSNDTFKVEEIFSSNNTGFKIFKIAHSGFLGRSKDDYQGGRAWLLCDEIETTAVSAKKFPNKNILYEPDLPQPKAILDVVSMSPSEPYEKIQKGRYNYLTDVIFHEAGHIEQRRLEDWREGEETIGVFSSPKKEAEFKSAIQKTRLFPEQIVDSILENFNEGSMREMYAMLIDREGAKRYDPEKFNQENNDFQKMLVDMKNGSDDQEIVRRFKKSLQNPHRTGRFLVHILEEQFPDFNDRKKFLRSVLGKSVKEK